MVKMIGNHRIEREAVTLIPSLFLQLLETEIPLFLLRKNSKISRKIKNTEDEEKLQYFVQSVEEFLYQLITHKTNSYPQLFYKLMKELSILKLDKKWNFFSHANRATYTQILVAYLQKEKFKYEQSEPLHANGIPIPNVNHNQHNANNNNSWSQNAMIIGGSFNSQSHHMNNGRLSSSFIDSQSRSFTNGFISSHSFTPNSTMASLPSANSELDNHSPNQNSPGSELYLSTSPTSVNSFLRVHKISQIDSKVYLQEAKDLLCFFERYSQDPFSTLIGIKPCDSLIKASLQNDHFSSQLIHGEIIIGISDHQNDSSSSSSLSLSTMTRTKSISNPKSLTFKKKKLFKTESQTASSKYLLQHSFGYLQPEKTQFEFARYLYTNPDHSIQTQIDLENNTTKSFNAYFRIPDSFLNDIIQVTPDNLRQFTASPTDKLYREMLSCARSKILEYLKIEELFDYNLFETMELCNYNNQRIEDYWVIIRNEKLLQSLYPKLPAVFHTELQSECDQVAQQFISENHFFIPTFEKELALISTYPQQAAIDSINFIAAKYQTVLENIKTRISDVLNGTRKNSLLKWWLKEINNQISIFLSSKNYIAEAIPENYLETPPRSMLEVKSNLSVLKKILNPKNTTHSPIDIIQDLKDTIYPKIDQLIVDIKYSIIIQMGGYEKEYSIKEIETIFERKKNDMQENIRTEIENTLKDLEYLCEMIKLEDPVYAAQTKSFHIVPVSGLAYSVLFRMENECRTVLEYWSSKIQVPQSPMRSVFTMNFSSMSDICQMKRAISLGDLSEFKKILSNNIHDIDLNELDDNGFNVFHCCAVKRNLSMCEVLLDDNRVNVNMQNIDGNSPLHFLVRITDVELEGQLITIIKKLIRRGANVLAVNKYYETPLHCCFRGFSSIGKLLLDNNADPNFPTLREETPLHYAVKAENIGMIKVLLEAKADPFIGNSSGDTPLSLAIRFKNPIAESLLTK